MALSVRSSTGVHKMNALSNPCISSLPPPFRKKSHRRNTFPFSHSKHSHTLTSTRGFAAFSSKNTQSISLDLPCLPFPITEVFIPSATVKLHLYEARFLALLEEAMNKHKNHLVHFVYNSSFDPGRSEIDSLIPQYGCLSFIEKVERLPIGALVTLRGIGRVNIIALCQTEPFIRGTVQPMQDEVAVDYIQLNAAVSDLNASIRKLHNLQIKMKSSKFEQLETPLWSSLSWAEKGIVIDSFQEFLPNLAERISFAAFQPVTGVSNSELEVLLDKRLQAMEFTTTYKRLMEGKEFVEENISMVAAKLAIQSLEL